jgi:hypothetical protein
LYNKKNVKILKITKIMDRFYKKLVKKEKEKGETKKN